MGVRAGLGLRSWPDHLSSQHQPLESLPPPQAAGTTMTPSSQHLAKSQGSEDGGLAVGVWPSGGPIPSSQLPDRPLPGPVPAAQHGEHILVELGRRGLSLADRPDRQTALQRELGAGRPAISLGRSGRRQLARPAGCLMSPTQFFTPYFSNKKAVRLQPQPSGRRAPEPPGSTAAFPTSSRVPRARLGGSVGKHVGD